MTVHVNIRQLATLLKLMSVGQEGIHSSTRLPEFDDLTVLGQAGRVYVYEATVAGRIRFTSDLKQILKNLRDRPDRRMLEAEVGRVIADYLVERGFVTRKKVGITDYLELTPEGDEYIELELSDPAE